MAVLMNRLMLRCGISSSSAFGRVSIRGFCLKSSESDLSVETVSSLSAAAAGIASNSSKDSRHVQWVFLGCPGVGKGTYATRLSNLLGVPHISTGDLVRHELASDGPLASQVLFTFVCLFVPFSPHPHVVAKLIIYCGILNLVKVF